MTGGTVVVLGGCGRNFAAGMSGGTAFVWNLDRRLVNTELVDLSPPGEPERARLHELVQRHFAETDSAVAEALLKRWPEAVEEFTAVVPRDYRRVLEIMQAAEAAGQDVDEAVMSALAAPPAPAARPAPADAAAPLPPADAPVPPADAPVPPAPRAIAQEVARA